jgi:hypothetical protein
LLTIIVRRLLSFVSTEYSLIACKSNTDLYLNQIKFYEMTRNQRNQSKENLKIENVKKKNEPMSPTIQMTFCEITNDMIDCFKTRWGSVSRIKEKMIDLSWQFIWREETKDDMYVMWTRGSWSVWTGTKFGRKTPR